MFTFPNLSLKTLDLELRDLEPAVNKEVVAAEQLLKPQPKDVPPQLLLALEKDGRSLARGYEAARALSDGILQSLRDHKDSYKVKKKKKSNLEKTRKEHLFLGSRLLLDQDRASMHNI